MARPAGDLESPDTQHDLLALAEQAARAGGNVARQYFRGNLNVRLKADRSEVSNADEAAQEAVIACIRASRPADAFIAEEQLELAEPAPPPTNDELCWVIDPIDGTRNFVRGVPLYACSVAAMLHGTPLVGAILDPQRDVLYSASRAGGLCINGRHLPPRDESTPPAHSVSPKPVVALPSSPTGPTHALAHRWLDRFVCRCLGSTTLHLALLASGELDGMLADNPRLWDIAAGWLLVTASGGRMTSPTGSPLFPLDVGAYVDQELPSLAASAAAYGQLISA